MPNRRVLFSASSTGGSRTHRRSRRFELRRFTGLRTVLCPAPSTGFEPAISTVTGWRALRTAPQGRAFLQWLRWDSNPQHPSFLNPDQLGWSQSCCHYTRDVCRVVDQRKPWDSNPQAVCAAACFQDRFLIQPDDFRFVRSLQAAGAGIEPTSRRSERPVLPLDDPAVVVCDTSGRGRFGRVSRHGERESNPHRLVQSQEAYR